MLDNPTLPIDKLFSDAQNKSEAALPPINDGWNKMNSLLDEVKPNTENQKKSKFPKSIFIGLAIVCLLSITGKFIFNKYLNNKKELDNSSFNINITNEDGEVLTTTINDADLDELAAGNKNIMGSEKFESINKIFEKIIDPSIENSFDFLGNYNCQIKPKAFETNEKEIKIKIIKTNIQNNSDSNFLKIENEYFYIEAYVNGKSLTTYVKNISITNKY